MTSQDPADSIAVRRMLKEVDERGAQAAICVYVHGMSQREAADYLGVARRTVINWLQRFQRDAGTHL